MAEAVARRRTREAAIERTALGGILLLALTVSGFAGYAMVGAVRPYAVQAVLPAQTGPFPWKKGLVAARRSEPDLDPATTGSIPDRAAAPPSAQRPAAFAGREPADAYRLRGVSGGVAVVDAGDGPIEIALGSWLPGAGRVLSIRRTGAGWVVITTETIIGPAPL